MPNPSGKLIYCHLCWRDWTAFSEVPDDLECVGCQETVNRFCPPGKKRFVLEVKKKDLPADPGVATIRGSLFG